MNRISVLGVSGTGKTTLGKNLAAKTGIPSVDLDELSWEADWTPAPEEEFRARMERAIAMPRWVISGNYSRVQDKYLTAADTLIWLDYSLPVILWRVGTRTLRRVVRKEPCCNGNFESWQRTFSRESIILWVFQNYKRRRRSAEVLFREESYPHLKKLRFRSPRQTQEWLDSL